MFWNRLPSAPTKLFQGWLVNHLFLFYSHSLCSWMKTSPWRPEARIITWNITVFILKPQSARGMLNSWQFFYLLSHYPYEVASISNPHFGNEIREAQRGERTDPRSLVWEAEELEFQCRSRPSVPDLSLLCLVSVIKVLLHSHHVSRNLRHHGRVPPLGIKCGMASLFHGPSMRQLCLASSEPWIGAVEVANWNLFWAFRCPHLILFAIPGHILLSPILLSIWGYITYSRPPNWSVVEILTHISESNLFPLSERNKVAMGHWPEETGGQGENSAETWRQGRLQVRRGKQGGSFEQEERCEQWRGNGTQWDSMEH